MYIKRIALYGLLNEMANKQTKMVWLLGGYSVVLNKTRGIYVMDDTIMEKGKWKGKTYKYIRTHDPSYMLYLASQPAGSVVSYLKFIQYCISILKTDDTSTVSDSSHEDILKTDDTSTTSDSPVIVTDTSTTSDSPVIVTDTSTTSDSPVIVTDSSRRNVTGYVYCFSNESFPGIYKIGFTRRPIKYRLKEANRGGTWSVPTPFVADIVIKVKDPMYIEKCIHRDLKEYRLDSSREFFRVSIEHIQDVFQKYNKYPENEYLTNMGKKWTTEEEGTLLDELDKNISSEVIAKNHKRTVGAIRRRQCHIAYNMYVKNVCIEEIKRKTRLNKEQIIEAIKIKEEHPRNKEKKGFIICI